MGYAFSEDTVRTAAKEFGTPLQLYDENLIRATCRRMHDAFQWTENVQKKQTLNFFAVKATPNPHILRILKEEGFGVDCSSLTELQLAESVGFTGGQIMFTSNETPLQEYRKAIALKALINLDDISHLDFLTEKLSNLPQFLSFRYNPGKSRMGNAIIGTPEESKFGVTRAQLFAGYKRAAALGITDFGLHTMVVSNCLDIEELVHTAKMIFTLVREIKETLGISLKLVDLGGGIGVPYKPEDKPIDLHALSERIRHLYEEIITPACLEKPLKVTFECGRAITGPAGVLVTRIIHMKDTYKKYLGVDACMAHLARPALYGAFHTIEVMRDDDPEILKDLPTRRTLFEAFGEPKSRTGVSANIPPLLKFDVVGSLCENNDKFAIGRELPSDIQIGDLLLIRDTGAHGHCMGSNYNGKLRGPEILVRAPNTFTLIRRRETFEDLISTITPW